MRILVSWSGARSQQLARGVKDLLKLTIQATDPWMSSEDIEKGSRWFQEIGDVLNDATFCVVCVTPENRQSLWLAFEAGAVAKAVGKSHVCPLLLELAPSDIVGPLSHFQVTSVGRDDVFKMVQAVNNCLGEKSLPASILDRSFGSAWPEFERAIAAIEQAPSPKPERPTRELLEEILGHTRELIARPTPLRKRALEELPNFSFEDLNAPAEGVSAEGGWFLPSGSLLVSPRHILQAWHDPGESQSGRLRKIDSGGAGLMTALGGRLDAPAREPVLERAGASKKEGETPKGEGGRKRHRAQDGNEKKGS